MDSLILVLIVVGVIMILAGIARMTNRNRYHREDVDHSILFSNSDVPPGDDEPIVHEDIKMDEDVEVQIEERRHESHEEGIDVDILPVSISAEPEDAPTSSKKRNISIFDRLKVASLADVPEENASGMEKQYREGAPEWVVVLNVMAPKGQHFVGPVLVDTIEKSGFSFGEMSIFHYRTEKDKTLFSLINMVKPGSFDIQSLDSMTTPGISLFVQIPNEQCNGVKAFESMLETARHLATNLGGELRDEKRSVLTNSAIDHLRQKIVEYDCKWLQKPWP